MQHPERHPVSQAAPRGGHRGRVRHQGGRVAVLGGVRSVSAPALDHGGKSVLDVARGALLRVGRLFSILVSDYHK